MKHIIIAFAFLVSFGAQAAAIQHEISGGTSSTLALTDGNNTFTIDAGYGYSLDPSSTLQLTAGFTLATTSNATLFAILAGPRFNIPSDDDLLNRFFVGGLAGITSVSVGSLSDSKFTFGFEAGKRFKLSDNVAFVPSVSFAKVADADGVFGITPVAFSFGF